MDTESLKKAKDDAAIDVVIDDLARWLDGVVAELAPAARLG